jgi:hypothetical protein
VEVLVPPLCFGVFRPLSSVDYCYKRSIYFVHLAVPQSYLLTIGAVPVDSPTSSIPSERENREHAQLQQHVDDD